MSNVGAFTLDITKWARETVPAEVAKLQRTITAEALTLIVQATPVGNNTQWKSNIERAAKGKTPASRIPLPRGYVGGHARKNWQVTIGSPSRNVIPGVDATGGDAISSGLRVAASIKEPGISWISNPLPYMDRLENYSAPGRSSWSKQAPKGSIVAKPLAELAAKYARVK
jgi:hypothetical protein